MSASSPKLWAGRFSEETDARVHEFNASLSFDSRLWPYDILGSIAHVKMLGECGIIPQAEASSIADGLETLGEDLKSGAAALNAEAEDVHMAVESLLTERLGPVAGKLHTARSRNDQVATDLRLYVRDAVDNLRTQVGTVQTTLTTLAEEHLDTLLPGMTHLQHAQPVRLAHHFLAYFWMLGRDSERLQQARARVNQLPLGAGALAGTTFPINRQRVAELLGFDGVVPNSLDAVSDRDFAIETVFVLSLVMMHLSRFCEELILWSTPEFGWATMGDSVTTGSSIMPQKKNPDVAELVRGKTGRVYGDLTALLTLMKGLPLAYNKDMQEDKEALFDALDTAAVCLPVMNTLLQHTKFNAEKMAIVAAWRFFDGNGFGGLFGASIPAVPAGARSSGKNCRRVRSKGPGAGRFDFGRVNRRVAAVCRGGPGGAGQPSRQRRRPRRLWRNRAECRGSAA